VDKLVAVLTGSDMVKRVIIGLVLVAATAGEAAAQAARGGNPQDEAQAQARYKVFVMEGALERAVQNGAAILSRQIRSFSPDAMFLTGAAQVRGFRLDGYGVFFDVEVPALRPTFAWTLRAMVDDNGASLERIRAYIRKVADPRDRADLELALRNLEVQMPGRVPAANNQVAAQNVATGQAAASRTAAAAVDPQLLSDPNAAYTTAVKNSIVDAMLENGGPLSIAADEWLTIAARDGEAPSPVLPGDAYDLTTTTFRVRGSDLAAYRAGRLTLDEARKKVEIKEN
jgi:hypothetical protein